MRHVLKMTRISPQSPHVEGIVFAPPPQRREAAIPQASENVPAFSVDDSSGARSAAEFLLEFVELQQLAVLHSGLDTARKDELITMLKEQFPPEMIQEHIYGLALGAFVGLSALAVVAFEG